MNEKIEVLGLKIDNLIAKDAMKCVMSHLETEPLGVVQMVTMHTLGTIQQDEAVSEVFDGFELTLAGDKGILQAAGVKEERRLREAEELLFLKMVMRFLHKNSIRVFLLAQSEADMQKLETYMREDYANIQVTQKATMEAQGASDDRLLNLMNGAEADVILSVLPSPLEEQFVSRNKALVNARVWFGLGNLLDEMRRQKTGFRKLKEFILRQILKKEMEKKGKNA